MKAYLIITGAIFGLLGLLHFVLTITHWHRLTADPWFLIQGPGIGLLGTALCFWAAYLFCTRLRT